MTIKNWEDWKERVYSTYKINLNEEGVNHLLDECGMSRVLEHLADNHTDRILDATFCGDQVMLTVVKFENRFKRYHKAVHKFLLNRNHINSVEYKY